MAATTGHALELLTLTVDRLDAGAWSAGDVAITLGAPAPGRISARLSGRGLVLPPPLDTLQDVSVDCPLAEVAEASIVCAEATLRATDEGRVPMELPLAMGLERDGGGWRLRLDARELDPAPLWRLAAAGGRLPGIEFAAGGLSVSLVLGPGGAASSANVRARLSGATFSDPSGLHAGEDLDARLDAVVTRAAGGWRATATLATDAGQAYLDPIFVDAAAAPITLAAEADLADGEPARTSVSFRIRHENVADVAGTLSLEDVAIRSLDLEIPSTPMAAVYGNYLQPFAIGTLFDALQMEGRVGARLRWRPVPEGWRARLDVRDVSVDDDAGRFRVSGLDGRVDWRQAGGSDRTRLAWRDGRLYRIDFGAGALEGRLDGRRFGLGAPIRVPLLGGAVEVEALEVAAIGTRSLQWRFRGAVEPMSLEALTAALGWPPFGGTLGGEIPLVSYADGVVTVDGSLDVSVFEGAVSVHGLSITDPFGVVPVLRADADFEDLSLDALTSTFSFGNIQGRLQGRIHGLILKDWRPTAFDARFATPEDDDSRHRISQRAVENLASLGGAGAVLSTTFLRLFDEFSYRRLGLGCRLENGVCEMDGVAPAQRGYYIVEGGGLPPRIDVLGFNRRVDWEILLGRIRQIVTSDGPVVR